MKDKQLLIIECTPKKDQMNEWLVLSEFLKMSVPKNVHSIRRSSKNEVISYLNIKRYLEKYDCVHLSGHGSADECILKTPKGDLSPEDFPEGCFDGKTVTLSACWLGKKSFIDRFIYRTSAKFVIAPQRIVLFVDAALWFVTFYYHVLHMGRKPITAYHQTEESLGNMKGALQFWNY